jgi:DNA-binding NarL/FixJ family response regulator
VIVDLARTPLSRRQRETLQLLLEGHSAKTIASKLDLSVHTVNEYIQAVYRAKRVQSRGELLARARVIAEDDDVPLSRRQRETLRLLLGGDSAKMIASKLGLSVHTVNEYIQAIYRAKRVQSRAELMGRARVSQ